MTTEKTNPWSRKAKPKPKPSLAGLKKPAPTESRRKPRPPGLNGTGVPIPKNPQVVKRSAPSATRRNLPPRDDQIVIRQPWAKSPTPSYEPHIKRATRLIRQFSPGSSVTVSWRWDASSAFSTRPDAVDDSFSGKIEKYDELGQMHLKNERSTIFVIPCAHITGIK